MRDLKSFRKKVEGYYKQKNNKDGLRYTQRELAEEIGINKDELSKRLNSYEDPKTRRTWQLTDDDVLAIVRTLAKWSAITSQEQAIELLKMMTYPHISSIDWKAEPLSYLRPLPARFTHLPSSIDRNTDRQRQEERLFRLHAIRVDHRGFLRNRLESFVGRERELAEIRQLIDATLPAGGYITITGQAGQGKSSIIAKLVQEYIPEKTAHHFIPLNPGPGYQVSVLLDLLSLLVLKHDLSDLYVASESQATLQVYLSKVLNELAEKGQHEVIFIDGLDQLKEDVDGERDLSFLPASLPRGMVFVLGTRPNDTLRPLELRKPYRQYQLPNLSKHDFELILKHRGVKLDTLLVEQFYQAMQQNALYLDLVAKELTESAPISTLELVKRIVNNPEHLFSVSMDRLGRSRRDDALWDRVIKPILGVLLVAREPLAAGHIRQIIRVDADRFTEGIRRLGGMLTDEGQQHYTLFHLKLRDYLRHDETNPGKDHIFAADEEQSWHNILADWCEQGNLSLIWKDAKYDPLEQGRRAYAQRHYISHLYYAHEWSRLFRTLDSVQYGQAKIRHNLDIHLFAQDLDLGRQAATGGGWTMEERIALLPYLWRYALLRCSLTSLVDNYPLAAFRLLLLLERKQEALNKAALLTNPMQKTIVLYQTAKHLSGQLGGVRESARLLLWAYEVALTLEGQGAGILGELGIALAEIQQWERAEAVIHLIGGFWGYEQPEALSRLGAALVRAQQWERAEALIRTIHTIENVRWCARAVGELGVALVDVRQWERAERIWTEAEALVGTIESEDKESWLDERTCALRDLGTALMRAQQWERAEAIIRSIENVPRRAEALDELGVALAEAQQWDHADMLMHTIVDTTIRLKALSKLGAILAQEQQWERAKAVWREVEAAAQAIEESNAKIDVLQTFGVALAQAQQWESAEAIWSEIATLIRPPQTQNDEWVLSSLQRDLIKTQQWKHAEAVAYMSRGIERSFRLRELGVALAQASQWEWAVTIIHAIEDSEKRAGALRELVTALAEAQQWERAESVVHEIKDVNERAQALCELGLALAQRQQSMQAQMKWNELEALVRLTTSGEGRSQVLSKLGAVLAKAQQWGQAEFVWREAERIAHTIEKQDTKVNALLELAAVLNQSQQLKHATDLWIEAEETAYTIEDQVARNRALSKLLTTWTQVQQWEHVEAVLQRLELWKFSGVLELIMALARAQEWERAESVLYSLSENQERSLALSKLGVALKQSQQWERAEDVLQEAERLARAVEQVDKHVEALGEVAIALAESQQWERAEDVLQEALQEAERDAETRERERDRLLRRFGQALVRAKQWGRASAIIPMIEKTHEKVDILSELAASLVQNQQMGIAEVVLRELLFTMNYGKERTRELYELEFGAALNQLVHFDYTYDIVIIPEPIDLPISDCMFVLIKAQRGKRAEVTWTEAETVIRIVERSSRRDWALGQLGKAFMQSEQWRDAEALIFSIEQSTERVKALLTLAGELAVAGRYEQLLHLVQHAWLQADTREYLIPLFSLATTLISLKPEIGLDFCEAFTWVDAYFTS